MMFPGWIYRCLYMVGAALLSSAVSFAGPRSTSGVTIQVAGPPPVTMADLAGTYLNLIQSNSYEETGSFRLTVNSQGRGTASPSGEAVATGTGGLGNGATGAGSVKVGSGTIVIGNPGTYPGDVVVTGNPPPAPGDTTSGGSPQIGSLPGDSSGAVLQPVDPYTGYTTGASMTTGAWMTFTTPPYLSTHLTGQTGTTTAIPAGTILIISGTTLPAGDRFIFGTAPDTSTYTSLQLLQWVEAAHANGVSEMNMNGVRVILQ